MSSLSAVAISADAGSRKTLIGLSAMCKSTHQILTGDIIHS